jgi:hypothetical protein
MSVHISPAYRISFDMETYIKNVKKQLPQAQFASVFAFGRLQSSQPKALKSLSEGLGITF